MSFAKTCSYLPSRQTESIQAIDYQSRYGMWQSAYIVFPQVALFLELTELVRLETTSKDLIAEDRGNEIWLSVCNNANTGFVFANLGKGTLKRFVTNVVPSIPVIDNDPICVDSTKLAHQFCQVACRTRKASSEHLLRPGAFVISFLTRFHFDEDSVHIALRNPSEEARSFPVIFDLAGDLCLIELTLRKESFMLSVHSLKNEEEEEPVPLKQPLQAKIRSMMSPVVLHREYLLIAEDQDECGSGLCWLPLTHEKTIQTLVEGLMCMVSLSDVVGKAATDVKISKARCKA